jgi:hypothetical protein
LFDHQRLNSRFLAAGTQNPTPPPPNSFDRWSNIWPVVRTFFVPRSEDLRAREQELSAERRTVARLEAEAVDLTGTAEDLRSEVGREAILYEAILWISVVPITHTKSIFKTIWEASFSTSESAICWVSVPADTLFTYELYSAINHIAGVATPQRSSARRHTHTPRITVLRTQCEQHICGPAHRLAAWQRVGSLAWQRVGSPASPTPKRRKRWALRLKT